MKVRRSGVHQLDEKGHSIQRSPERQDDPRPSPLALVFWIKCGSEIDSDGLDAVFYVFCGPGKTAT